MTHLHEENGVWSADAGLPGDNFVNPLFNSVVLVTVGIISVKRQHLACLIGCIAIAVHLVSTWARDKAHSTALWRTAPVTTVTPEDVYEFLMLSLVRWVASAIVAAFGIRLIVHTLTLSAVMSMLLLYQNWFIILPVCGAVFARGWSEFLSFEAVSHDWGLIFYFTTAQLMDAARAALQVVLLFPIATLNTSTSRGQRAVAHMFVFSFLTAAQNLCSYGLTGNICSWMDILLQLLLMKKTCWAYVTFLDFIGAVISIPISLLFPPYDDDYVPEDLAEIVDWFQLALSSAESQETDTESQETDTEDNTPEPSIQFETQPDGDFEFVSGLSCALLLLTLQTDHLKFLGKSSLPKPQVTFDPQSQTLHKYDEDMLPNLHSLLLLEQYGGIPEEYPMLRPPPTCEVQSEEPDSGIPEEDMPLATCHVKPLQAV